AGRAVAGAIPGLVEAELLVEIVLLDVGMDQHPPAQSGLAVGGRGAGRRESAVAGGVVWQGPAGGAGVASGVGPLGRGGGRGRQAAAGGPGASRRGWRLRRGPGRPPRRGEQEAGRRQGAAPALGRLLRGLRETYASPPKTRAIPGARPNSTHASAPSAAREYG